MRRRCISVQCTWRYGYKSVWSTKIRRKFVRNLISFFPCNQISTINWLWKKLSFLFLACKIISTHSNKKIEFCFHSHWFNTDESEHNINAIAQTYDTKSDCFVACNIMDKTFGICTPKIQCWYPNDDDDVSSTHDDMSIMKLIVDVCKMYVPIITSRKILSIGAVEMRMSCLEKN